MHHHTSKVLLRDNTASYHNISSLTTLPHCPLFQSWNRWETCKGHVMSERNASVQPGLQSEYVVVAHIHGEVAECLWEKEEKGRPLSVSNWPLYWWRAGCRSLSPCSPGTVPSGVVGWELDRRRSTSGTGAEPSDSICRFLHSREEGDGESQRQVGPPPTSWHCNQHLPTAKATFLSPCHHCSDSSQPLFFSS